jgi:hypothetical protein
MSKSVFFLGAGFSKAINSNYPVLSELSQKIKEKLTDEKYKGSTCNHYHELTEKLTDNVEELLTFLMSDLPWKTEEQKFADLALYHVITEIISEYLKSLPQQLNTEDWYMSLAKFAIDNYKDVNFITLNYDTLLELMLVTYHFSTTFVIKNGQSVHDNTKPRIHTNDFYNYPMSLAATRENNGTSVWGHGREIIKIHIHG